MIRVLAVAAAVSALLAPAQAATIAHDSVVPFAEPAANTTEQRAAVMFKPQLHITNGCHPYAAVDAQGHTNGGLAPTGATDGGCSNAAGRTLVYGRAAWYNGFYGIMYAWYFPKDSPSSGLGHRHDWENVIIWIDNPTYYSPTLFAVSASVSDGYTPYYPPEIGYFDGFSSKIEYANVFLDHRVRETTLQGEKQPLIMWEQLTDAARMALEQTDFGYAKVPLRDEVFQAKLAEAWFMPKSTPQD